MRLFDPFDFAQGQRVKLFEKLKHQTAGGKPLPYPSGRRAGPSFRTGNSGRAGMPSPLATGAALRAASEGCRDVAGCRPARRRESWVKVGRERVEVRWRSSEARAGLGANGAVWRRILTSKPKVRMMRIGEDSRRELAPAVGADQGEEFLASALRPAGGGLRVNGRPPSPRLRRAGWSWVSRGCGSGRAREILAECGYCRGRGRAWRR